MNIIFQLNALFWISFPDIGLAHGPENLPINPYWKPFIRKFLGQARPIHGKLIQSSILEIRGNSGLLRGELRRNILCKVEKAKTKPTRQLSIQAAEITIMATGSGCKGCNANHVRVVIGMSFSWIIYYN